MTDVKTKKNIGISLLLLFCILFVGGCKKQEEIVPTLLDPVQVKLDSETVVRDTIYDIDLYEGSVVPYTQGIYFEQDSKIGAVMVGVGDYVEKGQTLLALDRTTWQEEVDTLTEEITYSEKINQYNNDQADCDLEIAKLQLEALLPTGTPEEIALKNVELEAMEEQKEYTLKLQELDLNKKKERLVTLEQMQKQEDLIAPFSGTVIYCANLHEGSTVAAYDSVIVMADDTQMTIQTNYLSGDILRQSHDYYALIGDKQYEITNVPYTEDEYKYRVYNKLTMKSNFVVNDPNAKIECGMYAALCFTRSYKENVLAVPKKALYRDGSIRYVYRIVEGERIRTEVEVGSTTRIMAEIVSGLSEGDEVYVQQ